MNLPEITIKVSIKKGDKQLLKINSPSSCASAFRMIFDADTISWKEEVVMLLLNTANELIGTYKISSGGTASCVIDPKIVFTVALQGCATNIILAHNHPSGNLKPSNEDIALTKKLVDGGRLLGITVFDHLIITENLYLSMQEEGLM